MKNNVTFEGTCGDKLIIDFDKHIVHYERVKSCLELTSLDIRFEDITAIEYQPKERKTVPIMMLIVDGKRPIAKKLDYCSTKFCFKSKRENPFILEILNELAKACNISHINSLNGTDAPKQSVSSINTITEYPAKPAKTDVVGIIITTIVLVLVLAAIVLAISGLLGIAIMNSTITIFIYVFCGGGLIFMIVAAIINGIKNPVDLSSQSSNGTKRIVKGAIVGAIIGGGPGAFVGALAQKNKIDGENNQAIIDAINKQNKNN